MPSGMGINDMKLMVGPNGTHWVAMPAEKAVDKTGAPKQIWRSFVDFASPEAKETFRNWVLNLLRRQHPEAFEGGET
jgi:hypothetical protein